MKKQPERMCVSCRKMNSKKSLIRLVLTPEGEISLDPTGKKPGRGAYVCRNRNCLKLAIKGHRFDKNLKARVDDAIVASLTIAMEALPIESVDEGETVDE
jgi:predicted RNA-binding protein YlxR (DUF448 family)